MYLGIRPPKKLILLLGFQFFLKFIYKQYKNLKTVNVPSYL